MHIIANGSLSRHLRWAYDLAELTPLNQQNEITASNCDVVSSWTWFWFAMCVFQLTFFVIALWMAYPFRRLIMHVLRNRLAMLLTRNVEASDEPLTEVVHAENSSNEGYPCQPLGPSSAVSGEQDGRIESCLVLILATLAVLHRCHSGLQHTSSSQRDQDVD